MNSELCFYHIFTIMHTFVCYKETQLGQLCKIVLPLIILREEIYFIINSSSSSWELLPK